MNELLSGWKDKKEVYIPPIEKYGFAEDVIIRNISLPKEEKIITYEGNDETVLAKEIYTGEDETVFATAKFNCLIIKRIKNGEQITVKKEEFIVGKQIECDYVIKDNPMISRKHVRIYQNDQIFWLEDMKSLNHTYVNDEMIKEPVKLTEGMKFRLSLDEEFEVLKITEN